MYRSPFHITEPREVTVAVELAPVQNVLLTMMLLGEPARANSIWFKQNAQTLTSAERHRNRLVFEGLGEAIAPASEHTDIDDYLSALSASTPASLRDRVLERFAHVPGSSEVPMTTLLADPDTFMQQVAHAYGADRFDRALFAEAYALLNDPPALHDLVVAHLRAMWERVAPEWRRQQPTLAREVRALKAHVGTMGALDAARTALQGDVPETIRAQFDGLERLVIVPSPHAGPLTMRFGSTTTLWLFVQPHAGKRSASRPSAKRAELVGPLTALADDTRLQILELLAQEGPLLAQEILARFDLSQPSLSRHLKQLTGSGYVMERRGAGANKRYEYNPATLEWTFRSVTHVLSEAPSAADIMLDVRDEYPDLRRYLDAAGRIVMWPPKRAPQQQLRRYLAEKFEAEREYTEPEVNEVLQQWSEAMDHATLRREMYNEHLLERARNGSRYWKGTGTGE